MDGAMASDYAYSSASSEVTSAGSTLCSSSHVKV